MNHDSTLVTVFAFILVLAIIRRVFRLYQTKLWHDTARLALEKGLPLPPPLEPWDRGCSRSSRGFGWWDIRRGLVLLAVGGALYLALPEQQKMYALIPTFLGIASLIFGGLALARPDKMDVDRDPQSPRKL